MGRKLKRSSRRKLAPAAPAARKTGRARASRAAATALPVPSGDGPRAGVLRVLCVDDHAVLVEGLKAHFAIDGSIEVVGRLPTAAGLAEEIDRLRPDLVMLDIEMPGPDAFEVTDRIRREHPEVRVIVLSAHIRDAFISAAFRSGVSAYFAKSDELDDIVRGMHEVAHSPSGAFLLGPKVSERCRPVAENLAANERHGKSGTHVDRAGTMMTLMDSLTPREAEILRLIGKGLSRVQIATQLCRSAKTIDAHQDRMMRKLGIETRADLMRLAIREGFAQA